MSGLVKSDGSGVGRNGSIELYRLLLMFGVCVIHATNLQPAILRGSGICTMLVYGAWMVLCLFQDGMAFVCGRVRYYAYAVLDCLRL